MKINLPPKMDDLVKTILDDIRLDEQLKTVESFSELHDFCDANTLGETEKYFDEFGVEFVDQAQRMVDACLPIKRNPKAIQRGSSLESL